MDDRDRRRALAAPAVSRTLRSPDFRGPAGGRQTIILVLADDTVGYMLDRLQDHGGTAVVAMVSSGTCKLAHLWPASDERLVVAQEDDVVADVHENTEVAMFFDYLAHVGTATVVRRITARLVTPEPFQPA